MEFAVRQWTFSLSLYLLPFKKAKKGSLMPIYNLMAKKYTSLFLIDLYFVRVSEVEQMN